MISKLGFLQSVIISAQAAIASIIPQQPLLPSSASSPVPLPLVIWHGLGDNFKSDGLRSVGDLAVEVIPGTYTYYVRLGSSPSSDRTASFFGNVTEQIAQVCTDIATHPVLSKAPAINAIGFSQGGQFLRAYVERCNSPPVANLVTFGSQHNGIADFQKCESNDWLCQGAQALLRGNTWSNLAQSRLVPAQYFRDAEEIDAYLKASNFLADVNNERKVKNETYKENMKKLERFAMYVFSDDVTVVPKESGWFSEVNATTGMETKLQKRSMYQEDWLGLKSLDEKGRLDFKAVDGPHMHLPDELLIEVFETYFRPRTKEGRDREAEWGRRYSLLPDS